MNRNYDILEKMHYYYVEQGLNCAEATIIVLSEKFDLLINQQVMAAAIGMNGAGGSGAQCGLIEGSLMFLGILGVVKNATKDEIKAVIQNYTKLFNDKFHSLNCNFIKPENEYESKKCRDLAKESVQFCFEYIIETGWN